MTHSKRLQRMLAALASATVLSLLSIAAVIWHESHQTSTQHTAHFGADVQQIMIERSTHPTISLSRHNNEGWQIHTPCRLAANSMRLQPLLSALSDQPVAYAADEVDLEAAGLKPAQARLTIDHTLTRIGHQDLSGQRRYALQNQQVFFIPEWILPLINGGLSALAQPELFTTPLQQLSFTPASTTPRPSLYHSAWTLQANEPDGTMHLWQSLSASQLVIWPPPGASPLPAGEMHARDTQNSTRHFELFSTERYVAIKPVRQACAYLVAPEALPPQH